MRRSIAIAEIAEILNLRPVGNDKLLLDGLNLVDRKSKYSSTIAYVTNRNYANCLEETENVKCVLLKVGDLPSYIDIFRKKNITYLLSEDPERDFYTLHMWLLEKTDFYSESEQKPVIGINCSIHPTAVIEDDVNLGNGVSIGVNTVIRKRCRIGDNVVIGNHCVVGSEGFQIIYLRGTPTAIKHVGGVHIGEHTYIGDHTTICNALFEGETYIGKNVKIDNMVHISHNCVIGDNAVLTAGTVLCGTVVVSDGVWIGMNSTVLNKVVIEENAKIGIGSVVTKRVPEEKTAYGNPARWRK